MATAVELVNTSLTESMINGFLQYEYTQTYQTFTNTRTASESEVLSAAGLPQIGQTVILAVSGSPIWCNKRVPQRVALDASAKKWHVTCHFTNYTQTFERDAQGFPVIDPVDAVKQVDVSYIEYSQPIDDAVLRSITQGDTEFNGGAAYPKPAWLETARGPVTNSASVPVYLTRTAYRKVIAVSQVFADWNNQWDTFAGAVNSDSVTIQETDSNGVRYSETFAPRTLRMRPPKKENIWKDAKLYYRRTFIMEHNPTSWIHAELDAGSKRYVYVGQNKPGGEMYTQEDLDELGIMDDYGYEEITTTSIDTDGNQVKVAIGDPVRLNGTGMEIPVPRSGAYDVNSQFFLNWDIYPEKAFGPLQL